MLLFKTCHSFEHFVSVCICSVPSNSRVLMLLGQLEKMDGDVTGKNVETTRQVTAKILHLIQTQGKGKNRRILKVGWVLHTAYSFQENRMILILIF